MKFKLLFFLLLLPLLNFAQQQKKSRPLSFKEASSNPFGKNANFSFSARLKNYPFNKAVLVQLVSFRTKDGQLTDTTKLYDNTPLLKNIRWISPFYETKSLSLVEVDQLTNIIYNYRHKPGTFLIDQGACYSPGNAILFLDEKGNVFDLLEICFHCKRMRSYSGNINLDHTCDHTLKMLNGFFKDKGIINTENND